jgi:hypothetical protein
MTASRVLTLVSIPEGDFSAASTTQKYPLGLQVPVENTAGSVSVYEYTYASGAALTVYQPYVFNLNSGSVSTCLNLTAPVTLSAPGARAGVPQIAIASGSYAFVLVKGYGKALRKAETYIVGDFFKLSSGQTSFAVDGSSGSTIKTTGSFGITLEAGTTNVAKAVYLTGEQALLA